MWLHNFCSVFFLLISKPTICSFDSDDLTAASAENLAVREGVQTKHLGIAIRHGSPGTDGRRHEIILSY